VSPSQKFATKITVGRTPLSAPDPRLQELVRHYHCDQNGGDEGVGRKSRYREHPGDRPTKRAYPTLTVSETCTGEPA
jgi:hypothetical protein